MRIALVVVASLLGPTLVTLGLVAGCSSSSSGGSGDGGAAESCAPIDSACGQPCEPGNDLGIGRFCNYTSDCVGTMVSTICATLGDPSEHFCTSPCNPPDAGDAGEYLASCGPNATCQCQGGQCGCYPSSCQ
jgi:hypothetical protein